MVPSLSRELFIRLVLPYENGNLLLPHCLKNYNQFQKKSSLYFVLTFGQKVITF